jgi:hypothetical protein
MRTNLESRLKRLECRLQASDASGYVLLLPDEETGGAIGPNGERLTREEVDALGPAIEIGFDVDAA